MSAHRAKPSPTAASERDQKIGRGRRLTTRQTVAPPNRALKRMVTSIFVRFRPGKTVTLARRYLLFA